MTQPKHTPVKDPLCEQELPPDTLQMQNKASQDMADYLQEITRQAPSWDDLNFLHQNEYALRHTSTQEKANYEMENGVSIGDAVSLACPQNQLLSESELPPIFGLLRSVQAFSSSYDKVPMESVPEDLKLIARLNFADSVRAFFENSIMMDLRPYCATQTIVAEAIRGLESDGSSFLIGKFYGAQSPYDVAQYFNLGKCGSQTVSSANLMGVLSLRGLFEEVSGIEGVSIDQPIDRLSHRMIAKYGAQHLWVKLIELIQVLREENSNSAPKD
jgi:hypothetical protein